MEKRGIAGDIGGTTHAHAHASARGVRDTVARKSLFRFGPRILREGTGGRAFLPFSRL
jgi:hypothetical protein